jgi:hypothetical protein
VVWRTISNLIEITFSADLDETSDAAIGQWTVPSLPGLNQPTDYVGLAGNVLTLAAVDPAFAPVPTLLDYAASPGEIRSLAGAVLAAGQWEVTFVAT